MISEVLPDLARSLGDSLVMSCWLSGLTLTLTFKCSEGSPLLI